VGGSPDAAAVRQDAHGFRQFELTGLEAVREALMTQGFSREVAARMASSVRASSSIIYDNKWKIFCEYCKKLNKCMDDIDIPFIADFLNYLFVDKKLCVSTIKGYRAAIGRVLKVVKGLDVSNSEPIRNLISNFNVEKPFVERILPKWDLKIILDSFKKAPYEPLTSASLICIARKTAFLLLLASGARRGEVHALQHDTIIRARNGNVWFLRPDPKFVAKNYSEATGKRPFEGIKVEKLASLSKDPLEDELLCPIRMLRWYLHRTSAKRGSIKQLFITNNQKGEIRPIHKNTLSSWIKGVIVNAYQITSGDASSLLHRSTHEVRAVAASYAAFGSVTVEQILGNCRWSGRSVFAKHYLRRVSAESEGFQMLLPLQLAGAILKH
jgi:hypothetical protein